MFKRRWIENFNIDFLDIEFNYTTKNDSGIHSNAKEFNFKFKKLHSVDMSLWSVGEASAISILNNKCAVFNIHYTIYRTQYSNIQQ